MRPLPSEDLKHRYAQETGLGELLYRYSARHAEPYGCGFARIWVITYLTNPLSGKELIESRIHVGGAYVLHNRFVVDCTTLPNVRFSAKGHQFYLPIYRRSLAHCRRRTYGNHTPQQDHSHPILNPPRQRGLDAAR